MLKERQIISETIHKILDQNHYEFYRNPSHHAGGKMVWRYKSLLGQIGNLEIDLNYMYRRTLWPCELLSPILLREENLLIPILDIHELAAGKLSALFTRQASRDLFDAYVLLTKYPLDINKLRLSTVIYLAMTDIDIKNIRPNMIQYDLSEINNRLLPVMQQSAIPRQKAALNSWANALLQQLTQKLSDFLPLNEKEIEFVENIRRNKVIRPELITENESLKETIHLHPAIQWALQK